MRRPKLQSVTFNRSGLRESDDKSRLNPKFQGTFVTNVVSALLYSHSSICSKCYNVDNAVDHLLKYIVKCKKS